MAAGWVVKDDPVPPHVFDTLTIGPSTGTGRGEWKWGDCCTDGGAIQGGLNEEWCITVDPNFISGIDNWVFLDGSTTTPTEKPLSKVVPVTIRTPLGVCPPSVGGIVELLGGSDSPASPADGSGSAAPLYGALAGGIAAGALALAAAGWYARRRWLR
jgi:hypothetical protein